PTAIATYLTNTSPLALAGSAADNVAVARVTWLNSAGGAGTASGTTLWSVPAIPLQPGLNVLIATARDAAGNTASATLTVTYDPFAPDTTITSHPAMLSNTFHPTFEFISTEPGSTFQCSLDGSPFAPCTSPWSYIVDVSGNHTFLVRAIDPAGNVDPTPASYIWNVDLIAPDTIITANPAALTGSTSASFSFTATEAGSTFECKLDGAAFAACTSPQSYGLLPGGIHTFQVRAIDPSGNTDQSPAGFTWTIDIADPTIAIMIPTSTGAYATFSNVVSIAGIAADNIGLSQVTWVNDRGGSGTALGTTSWTVSSVFLQLGTNVVTVTAQDVTGHTAIAILRITLSAATVFTDAPLVAQSTVVKAVHILELRAAIDLVRVINQLQPFGWFDPVLTPRVTQVGAIHLLELRAALNAAYQIASRPPPVYTNATIGPEFTIIRAIDLTELQAAVLGLQ
ncbi:MAG TPA: hypothetical protein VEQ67_05920, partial [Mycobacterium sp.]|nr:hypothetical protein [Mycobacterium sp.]